MVHFGQSAFCLYRCTVRGFVLMRLMVIDSCMLMNKWFSCRLSRTCICLDCLALFVESKRQLKKELLKHRRIVNSNLVFIVLIKLSFIYEEVFLKL